jgi:serine/threonine-protein kinase RsbW
MTDFSASRTFSADGDGIACLDDWLEETTAQWGVGENIAFRTRLCVAELATNLMQHDSRIRGATFTVTLARDGCRANVDYFDNGRAFDPTRGPTDRPSFSLETDKIGGLGLHLLRSYAAQLGWERVADHNHVSLCFFCTEPLA